MTVDWWQLRHAYGRATDTPAHLRALEVGDAGAREAALDHLRVAVLHQGFPETATAPAIEAVTALLAEGRAHPDMVDALVEFVGDAALSVTVLAGDRHFAQELPDVAGAVAAAYPVVLALLEASAPDRALFYAEHLVAIARTAPLVDQRQELAVLVQDWLQRGPGPRARWVRCLSQLGVDVRHLLCDPDPAVTLQAALGHEDDPRSQQLILDALGQPPPAGLHQSELIAAAIRVASGFDAIAPAACEIAKRDSWTGFDDRWGALVRFAFAEPYGPRQPLTGSQRALLHALVANDQLWDSRNGGCGLVFKQAGLPHRRDACRLLAGDAPSP
ncbi:hypothetical protein AB0C07_18010 [Actinoplanes missouriensis]|uniref:hypothetical protein n=1 Tax=Actinoplanes missouriensis TaxID=1866 RepID=UPI0033F8695A